MELPFYFEEENGKKATSDNAEETTSLEQLDPTLETSFDLQQLLIETSLQGHQADPLFPEVLLPETSPDLSDTDHLAQMPIARVRNPFCSFSLQI